MEDDDAEKKKREKERRALVDAYSDLASAFVPSLSIPELDFLFRVIKPYFKVPNMFLSSLSLPTSRSPSPLLPLLLSSPLSYSLRTTVQ
jgi:hypothetical protein